MFQQKIILVTGGGSGIGYAAAQMLAQQANIVYAASRTPECTVIANELKQTLFAVKLDVNNEANVEALVAEIVAKHGRLDVLVCNAGNGVAGAVEDCSAEDVKYQFETNFFGLVKCVNACLKQFRAQKSGKIISISSVAAMVPIPYQVFYSASKSAVLMFSKGLAMELKPWGIQCCCILPGDTKTGFTHARHYTAMAQNENSIYHASMTKALKKMEKDEENGMSPLVIAKAIAREVNAKKMNQVVVPGIGYKAICMLTRLLPTTTLQWVVRKMY